jgi:hypothetical protein
MIQSHEELLKKKTIVIFLPSKMKALDNMTIIAALALFMFINVLFQKLARYLEMSICFIPKIGLIIRDLLYVLFQKLA